MPHAHTPAHDMWASVKVATTRRSQRRNRFARAGRVGAGASASKQHRSRITLPGSAAGIGSAMHHLHRYGRQAVRLRLRPHVPAPEPPFRSDATVGLGGDERRAAREAHFGPWRVTTPLNNVKGAEVTGPYAWSRPRGRRAWRSPTAGSRSPRTGVAACASTSAHQVRDRPIAADQAPRTHSDRRELRAACDAADPRHSLTVAPVELRRGRACPRTGYDRRPTGAARPAPRR